LVGRRRLLCHVLHYLFLCLHLCFDASVFPLSVYPIVFAVLCLLGIAGGVEADELKYQGSCQDRPYSLQLQNWGIFSHARYSDVPPAVQERQRVGVDVCPEFLEIKVV
jgi:hypothetical protein